MGHIRLGRLPKTLRWQGVIALLDSAPDDVPALARATVTAADACLRGLARDPSLTHCFWLLSRITAASRGPDFAEAVAALGLTPTADSALAFVAHVSDQVRSDLTRYPESGPFSELASLALRRTLSETIGQHGRSLFVYARQSTRIMEEFAASWYSKHNWEAHGQISREEAQGFVAIALRKLRMELTRTEP